MNVLGIDFTSRPSRGKPLTCLRCALVGDVLHAQSIAAWETYAEFEKALGSPGPWIAGIDFPFGQARRFIETIGWPPSWEAYVEQAGKLGRGGFCEALTRYRAGRPAGDKEHRRATDKAARSISPQKLFGVPVGLMFFEGAPRLLASGVTIPHLKDGDPKRIVIEAYPGIIARTLLGRRSYKNDSNKKQTDDQHKARLLLLERLMGEAPVRYGFALVAPFSLCDDTGADHLDALLCAVQAAWAHRQRENGFGAPQDVDRLEGWIADPHLAATTQAERRRIDTHLLDAKGP
jgi:Protein of unknown function (DUF429)